MLRELLNAPKALARQSWAKIIRFIRLIEFVLW